MSKKHEVLVMPGEPVLYSVKEDLSQRHAPLEVFRERQWREFLLTYFKSFKRSNNAVAVIVTFYVSPPSFYADKIKCARNEKIPARYSEELADYFLALIDMMRGVIIGSFRQICSVQMRKYYSKNPRTELLVIPEDEYEQCVGEDTADPKAKNKRIVGEGPLV